MAGNYTVVNFDSDVENLAPQFGIEGLDARFARETLELQNSGVSRMRVEGNVRTPFGHKHAEQEEVYVVTKGSARVKLDDEIVELKQWDAIRIAPDVMRCVESGPDGLEMVLVGAPNPRDVEMVPNWWTD
jgi:mannose-6-phosphate isomerase-like protein (cupin superfamily)